VRGRYGDARTLASGWIIPKIRPPGSAQVAYQPMVGIGLRGSTDGAAVLFHQPQLRIQVVDAEVRLMVARRRIEIAVREELEREATAAHDEPARVAVFLDKPEPGVERGGRVEVARGQRRNSVIGHLPRLSTGVVGLSILPHLRYRLAHDRGQERFVRFMICVIDNETGSGSGDEMVAIDAFNAQLQSAGKLIMAEGLASPRASVVIDNRGGAEAVTPGPLHDTEQYISGFWIIEAADRDAALALAAEGSRACNRVVELRPFYGGDATAG
jgi:hypothetical protein